MKLFTRLGTAGLMLALAGLMLAPAAAQDGGTITVQAGDIAVGGLAWSEQTGLLVGSRQGDSIYTVRGDGALTPFIQDGALTGVSVMTADAATNRLYVVNSSGGPGAFDPSQIQLPEGFDPSQFQLPEGFDPSQFQPGQLPEGFPTPEGGMPDMSQLLAQMGSASVGLLVYDLTTGQQVLSVDLTGAASGAASLATGIAVDASGNAYITDGLASAVYRVDTAGAIAVLTDSQFSSEGIGLVGLAALQDDTLLLAKADGTLYVIRLSDPSNVQPVSLSAAPASISAITALADGRVATLDATSATVTVWTSSDSWSTAQAGATAAVPQGASVMTTDGVSAYVMQGLGGMMGALLSDDAAAPATTITAVGL